MVVESTFPHIPPLYWDQDSLNLLDQRKLPMNKEYVKMDDHEEVYEAIECLAVRGAPAIGIAAAYGMYLGVKNVTEEKVFWETLASVAQRLRGARPTAVNLAWAVDRIVEKVGLIRGASLEELQHGILEEAKAIHHEDIASCRQIGTHLLTLLRDGMGVLTHCNAGGLATSAYGTALSSFYLAKEKGWNLKVYVGEIRPVLQGSRLTAYELHEAGIDVTLICDTMAASVMKQGMIQAVIVGADRVVANGDVANKIGTYGLGILAKAHNIPFYVAAPSSSIDPAIRTGDEIPIEIRSSEEITHIQGKRVAPVGVKVHNPSFDVTPATYITAIVTETQVVYPPYSFSS